MKESKEGNRPMVDEDKDLKGSVPINIAIFLGGTLLFGGSLYGLTRHKYTVLPEGQEVHAKADDGQSMAAAGGEKKEGQGEFAANESAAPQPSTPTGEGDASAAQPQSATAPGPAEGEKPSAESGSAGGMSSANDAATSPSSAPATADASATSSPSGETTASSGSASSDTSASAASTGGDASETTTAAASASDTASGDSQPASGSDMTASAAPSTGDSAGAAGSDADQTAMADTGAASSSTADAAPAASTETASADTGMKSSSASRPEDAPRPAVKSPAPAATDVLNAWWAQSGNVKFVGRAVEGNKIVVLFNNDVDPGSAGSKIKVLDDKGQPVQGTWQQGANGRVLAQDVAPGRYLMLIDPSLAGGSGGADATPLHGPIVVEPSATS